MTGTHRWGIATVLLIATLLLVSAFAQDKTEEAATLAVGDTAPPWTLNGTGGETSLATFKGKSRVVMVFYPKDFTSVCTKQLCQLRDDFPDFKAVNTVAFGINDNPMESHEKFKVEHNFPFPLLVDPELKVAQKYGAAQPGQPFVDRTVVIVGLKGDVIFYAKGVPSSADMLAAIETDQ